MSTWKQSRLGIKSLKDFFANLILLFKKNSISNESGETKGLTN